MKPLRHRGAALLVAALVVLVVAVAWADIPLLSFSGYDYWWPSNCYNAAGYVPSVNSTYLNFDYGTNEYTFFLDSLCVANIDSLSFPGFYYITFMGGGFDVYGDSLAGGTAADYGVNPPNATVPSTFTDGENVLGGNLSQMEIYWDLTTGEADLSGMVDLNRGTQLGNIPPDQRSGWTLAGLRANTPGMPMGYSWQIDGSLYISEPTPTQKTSWGKLKQHYRGGE
jgi:hypothetical protein